MGLFASWVEIATIVARPDAIPVVAIVALLVFFSARSLRDERRSPD